MIHTLEWTDSGVRFIDQTKLPTEEVYVNCTTHQQVADVIQGQRANYEVRGTAYYDTPVGRLNFPVTVYATR